MEFRHALHGRCEKVIGAAFAVHKQPGFGFLEKVYENALAIEIRKVGLSVKQQFPIPVYYEKEFMSANSSPICWLLKT